MTQTLTHHLTPPAGHRGGEEREGAYRLADDGIFDPIDAAGEHSKGQRRVEAEVEQHVPSLPTDADRTAKKERESR